MITEAQLKEQTDNISAHIKKLKESYYDTPEEGKPSVDREIKLNQQALDWGLKILRTNT